MFELVPAMLSEVEVKLNLYNLPWLCGANHVSGPRTCRIASAAAVGASEA